MNGGAFYGHPNTLNAAQIVVKQFEKYLFSDTYWSYTGKNEIEGTPYFKMLAKPYPSNISGELVNYDSDLESLTFACSWKENPEISAPTRIYLPTYWFGDSYSVELEIKGDGYSVEQISGDGSSVYLVIPTTGRNIKRSLTIKKLP